MQKPSGSQRIAATWTDQNAFTVDVNLTDGQPYRVALEMLDWMDVA